MRHTYYFYIERSNFNFRNDPYEAVKQAKALVLITAWKEYEELDFTRIKNVMGTEPVIIDTSNLWDANYLEKLGFLYLDIGKGRKIKGKQ